MRGNFTQLYVHCVWATWDRLPLITPDLQPQIYAAMIQECQQLKAVVMAVGGIEDHIHLLVGFPLTLVISDLVKQAKGSSSHLVNHVLKPGEFFKWQGGYGAFTVGHNAIDQVVNYIKNQALHHQQKSTIRSWELESA